MEHKKDELLFLIQVKEKTKGDKSVNYIRTTVYFLLEWFCYAVAGGIFLLAFNIPSNPLEVAYQTSDVTYYGGIQVKQFMALIQIIKWILFFIAFFPLTQALLLRKLRKKTNLLGEISLLTENRLKKVQ